VSIVHGQNLSSDTYGKGLNIEAKDSTFSVKFGFRFQTLYQYENNRATGESVDNLLTRRSRLKFDGYAFNPNIEYKLELALSNRDQSNGEEPQPEFGATANIVLDAVVKWHFAPGWEVWYGQTKLPGNRERVISSQKMQFVDRSLVNSRFNLDRDLGIQIHHSSGSSFVFKQAFAVSLGQGRNVVIDNPYGGHQFTGRLEFLPMGEFTGGGDYFGSDLKREKSPKLSIGISGDLNQKAVRNRGNLGTFLKDDVTGEYISNDLKTIMADLMFKYNGFSFASEYAKRTTGQPNNGFGTGNGIVFQGGYLLPSNWEFAGRYTVIDGEDSSPIADVKETTFGISKYVQGHNLKIQTDLSYQDFATRDDQLIFRFQTELAF
jgi:hypothetical protein